MIKKCFKLSINVFFKLQYIVYKDYRVPICIEFLNNLGIGYIYEN